MKNSIDMRAEMSEFLQDYGIYVLLHRNGRRINCRCWDAKHQEGDPKCPLCGGEGWVGRIERHSVRVQDAINTVRRPDLAQQTKLGMSHIGAFTYYMEYNSHPKVGDLIYEVGWNGQKPTHLIEANRINHVSPVRGDNGRTEFWYVATHVETMNKDFKNILVRSIGPIKNYEIQQ